MCVETYFGNEPFTKLLGKGNMISKINITEFYNLSMLLVFHVFKNYVYNGYSKTTGKPCLSLIYC